MIDTLMQLAGSHGKDDGWFDSMALKSGYNHADEKDMALLPTDLVTSTVMTALKNKRNVSGFIISGYPRNMRDVTDYLEKVLFSLSLFALQRYQRRRYFLDWPLRWRHLAQLARQDLGSSDRVWGRGGGD